ncbi:hypothetical protein [uncultured phage]|nr:hypothetical protein [uncultured phage]
MQKVLLICQIRDITPFLVMDNLVLLRIIHGKEFRLDQPVPLHLEDTRSWILHGMKKNQN